MGKTRIAILGGGPAALATAFELSNTPELRDRFEVDLYQIGWRLGGKCASSRNRAARGRNEEHGLHVLGGFYHNVFNQLKPLYEEWARVSPETAIAFEDAFKGHDRFTLMQQLASGDWRPLSVELPARSNLALGEAPEVVTPREMLGRVLSWVESALRSLAHGRAPDGWLRPVEGWPVQPHGHLFDGAAGRIGGLAERLASGNTSTRHGLFADIGAGLREVQVLLAGLGHEEPANGPDWHAVIELLTAIGVGYARDHLDLRGFDSINKYSAKDWLKRHGASERAIACPLLQAGYHYSFAYQDGDTSRPDIAAGVGIRGLLRLVFTYHASVFIHMLGGMGEIVVTPYYEVLRDRGVRFHFFHRVEDLIPGPDGRLSEIRVRIQANPTGGSTAYDPLFDYDVGRGGRPRRAWPEAPLYEQLTDANSVRAAGDLEKWIDSAGVGILKSLKVDQDFDLCVTAMSIGALRETTGALAAANPDWAEMLRTAGLTPTIGAQVWRREPPEAFGGVWRDGLMTGYAPPCDTWADMSFLVELEQADADGARPGSLGYLCGPIMRGFGEARTNRPERETDTWLESHATGVFPGLADAAGGYRREGELERYCRINDDPIDLYVISPADMINRRLRADESGFPNLLLAGDWTRNSFDCGAVETAVLSGKLCARAICGSPTQIYGESDFA